MEALDDSMERFGMWWKTLREFNAAHRYGNASTEDFRSILEENSGRSWERFFDEWFYGEGAPSRRGEVTSRGKSIRIRIHVDGEFHVPLDVTWTEGGQARSVRVDLGPGENALTHACEGRPRDLAIPHLGRIPGSHDISTP